MMQKDNRMIAFVCTGNTCSPMAEAIFNDMAEKNGVLASARKLWHCNLNGNSRVGKFRNCC